MTAQNPQKEISNAAAKLAIMENRLWEIAEMSGFKSIPGGEDLILKIDGIVEKEGVKKAQEFLNSKEMQNFFKDHPEAKEGFEMYAQQHTAITKQTEALNEALIKAGKTKEDAQAISDNIIKNVDADFDDKNKDNTLYHLEKLKELRKAAENPETIYKNPELAAQFALAKLRAHTDETLGPDYVKHLLDKDIKGVKSFAAYERDFKDFLENKKELPEDLVKAVQKKLGMEPTGEMNEATKAAIIHDKKYNWTDNTVTPAVLKSLDKAIENLQKKLAVEIRQGKGESEEMYAAVSPNAEIPQRGKPKPLLQANKHLSI